MLGHPVVTIMIFACSSGGSENLVTNPYKNGAHFWKTTEALRLSLVSIPQTKEVSWILSNMECFIWISKRKVFKILKSLSNIWGKPEWQGEKASLEKLVSHFSAKGLSKLLRRKKKEKQVHIYIFKVASNQDNTNYLTTVKKPAAKPHWLFNRVSKCWTQP